MAATDDRTAAARRMRGYLANRAEVVPGGVVLWTEEGAGEWKADVQELREDLMLLGVPHYATITGRRDPPWRSATTKAPACRWIDPKSCSYSRSSRLPRPDVRCISGEGLASA